MCAVMSMLGLSACRTHAGSVARESARTPTPWSPTGRQPNNDYEYPPGGQYQSDGSVVTSNGNVRTSETKYFNGMRTVRDDVLGTHRETRRTYDERGQLRSLETHVNDGEVVSVAWDANGVVREIGVNRFTVHAGFRGELPPKFGEEPEFMELESNGPSVQLERQGWWTYFDDRGAVVKVVHHEPSLEP